MKDFHLYVTGYPQFFNKDTSDCNKTTFYFWDPRHEKDGKDGTGSEDVFLFQDLRATFDEVLDLFNAAINEAIKDANDALGNSNIQVHFVEINSRWVSGKHRWCESEDDHEPDEGRADTWFFLSAWKDVGVDGAGAAVSVPSSREIHLQY